MVILFYSLPLHFKQLIEFLDVIGYVLDVKDPEIVPTKNKTEIVKRKVIILDQLDREVKLNFICFSVLIPLLKYFLNIGLCDFLQHHG